MFYHSMTALKTLLINVLLILFNFLKLKDDKTEHLIITTREEPSKKTNLSIKVDDQSITPSDDPPRTLGAIFDSTCCLSEPIVKLCRSINFNLNSVGKISIDEQQNKKKK